MSAAENMIITAPLGDLGVATTPTQVDPMERHAAHCRVIEWMQWAELEIVRQRNRAEAAEASIRRMAAVADSLFGDRSAS